MGLLRRLLGASARPRPERDPSARALDEIVGEAERLRRDGSLAASLAVTAQALARTPEAPRVCYEHARSLLAGGRAREAMAWLERCDAGTSPHLDATYGWCLLQLGRSSEAVARLQRAANADPRDVAVLRGLAAVLHGSGHQAEAESYARQALDVAPGDAEALATLASILLRRGNFAGAEAALTQATERGAAGQRVWPIRAFLAAAQGNYDQTIAFRRKVCDAEPAAANSGDGFVWLAGDLLDAGRIEDVIALLERRLIDQPEVSGHLVYATALLRRGALREGFQQYEFRWLNEPQLSLRPAFRQPAWTGQDLRGKTILLHAEQGLGDAIQFARYAIAVKSRGATVWLYASKDLENLAKGFPGVDRVVGPGDALASADYFVPLMSLPRIFGTDLDSIPAAIPYLSVAAERKVRWARRLGAVEALRVGLVWAGRPQHVADRQRSISLAQLQPLATVSGVRFVSLQKGNREEEATAGAGAWLHDRLGPEMEDLADAAAVIDELDLVICVDTALAHLAGALGKPVWVLLQAAPDFRWMEGREDSPWYPTMRLFRQRERDEWGSVIERVRGALNEVVRSGGVASAKVPEPSPASWGAPANELPRNAPGHRPGMSAVAETRHGIMQYLPDEVDIGDALGWYGEWLEGQRVLLAGWLGPGLTVLEVGAGVGAHALWLARALGEGGHLMLYEPRAVHQRILRQNLVANRIANATLLRDAETLDDLQLGRLDWLKCGDSARSDATLEGASETLWRLRPKVIAAAADETQVLRLAQRLRECGYRCRRIETPLYHAQNFNRRDEDIFAGRMAVALLAIPEESDVGEPLVAGAEIECAR